MPGLITRGNLGLLALSLLMLSFTASAGTVVLTGTCVAQPANSSTLTFNIANSGNVSAAQMVINPTVVGANVSSHSIDMGLLSPGSNVTAEVNVTGIQEAGVHAVYYSAVYEQGGSIFSTVFPCLLPIHASTNSSLEMTVTPELSSSGTGTINVTVFNAGAPVTANVFLALSPAFTYNKGTQSSYSVSLAQYQSENLTFSVSFPPSLQLGYGAGAFATYSYGNESYGSLSIFTLAVAGQQTPPAAAQRTPSLLLYGMVAIIAAVVVLLIYSVARRGRKKKSGVVK